MLDSFQINTAFFLSQYHVWISFGEHLRLDSVNTVMFRFISVNTVMFRFISVSIVMIGSLLKRQSHEIFDLLFFSSNIFP